MPKPFKTLRNLLAWFITCKRGCITFLQMAAIVQKGWRWKTAHRLHSLPTQFIEEQLGDQGNMLCAWFTANKRIYLTEETLEKLRTVKTRDGLFALRVAVTVSTAAVPTLPFTRRHFLRGVSE